jgi:hypothetical protein
VKRVLLVVAATVLFVNTLVISTQTILDGGGGTTNCNGQVCKP